MEESKHVSNPSREFTSLRREFRVAHSNRCSHVSNPSREFTSLRQVVAGTRVVAYGEFQTPRGNSLHFDQRQRRQCPQLGHRVSNPSREFTSLRLTGILVMPWQDTGFKPLAGIHFTSTHTSLPTARAGMSSFKPLAGIHFTSTKVMRAIRMVFSVSFKPLAGIHFTSTRFQIRPR